jgi:hypothetical protein
MLSLTDSRIDLLFDRAGKPLSSLDSAVAGCRSFASELLIGLPETSVRPWSCRG